MPTSGAQVLVLPVVTSSKCSLFRSIIISTNKAFLGTHSAHKRLILSGVLQNTVDQPHPLRACSFSRLCPSGFNKRTLRGHPLRRWGLVSGHVRLRTLRFALLCIRFFDGAPDSATPVGPAHFRSSRLRLPYPLRFWYIGEARDCSRALGNGRDGEQEQRQRAHAEGTMPQLLSGQQPTRVSSISRSV